MFGLYLSLGLSRFGLFRELQLRPKKTKPRYGLLAFVDVKIVHFDSFIEILLLSKGQFRQFQNLLKPVGLAWLLYRLASYAYIIGEGRKNVKASLSPTSSMFF